MKRGGQNTKKPAKLGDMELEVTDKYKYLGQIMYNKGNLKDHIKMTKGKVEAAYQKILITAGNATFHYIEMEDMWKTLETNILPILTYSGEVWKATKKEEEEINRIYDNIIKRILKTPQSTPRTNDKTLVFKRDRSDHCILEYGKTFLKFFQTFCCFLSYNMPYRAITQYSYCILSKSVLWGIYMTLPCCHFER